MKHDDPVREDEQKLDRAIRRAFAGASELSPDAADDARIEAAIARTLLANDKKRSSPVNRTRITMYLVAAALCVGALAYAAAHQRDESTPRVSVAAPLLPASPAATLEKSAENQPPVEPAAPVATPEAVTPDSLPSVAPPRRASAPAPAVASAKAIEPAGEALGPAELFARANEARRTNDTKGAITLYEELQARFPDSSEASTSRVTLGRLLLDRAAEPARARALFDRYLDRDPSGPLAEEARVGRALAAMRLGDGAAERAAWLEVLDRHPGSVHAERARQRLGVLGN